MGARLGLQNRVFFAVSKSHILVTRMRLLDTRMHILVLPHILHSFTSLRNKPPSPPNKLLPPLTFLIHVCQLWIKYLALGRETQRFHMHLLMFLLLQQLWPNQQQNISTQRSGPGGPGGLGPGSKPCPNLCLETFCC